MLNARSRGIVPVVLAASFLLAAAPCRAEPESNIRQISYGKDHLCAVTTGGELLCWGGNDSGQIGNGRASRGARELDPVLVIPRGVTAVSAGTTHTCAIASGMLYCWGGNYGGQIGNGAMASSYGYHADTTRPAMIFSSDVKAVSAGGGHTCAIVGDDLQCWGSNWSGQIGNGSDKKISVLKPLTIIKGGVTAVSAGTDHTCAVVRGDLWCWGDNRDGQIGNGSKGKNVFSPYKVISGGVTAVVAGPYFQTCAIVHGGLQCWGANGEGRLDPGTIGDVLTPMTFIKSGVTAVAMSGGRVCAVVRSALQCWGYVGTNGDIGIATSDWKQRILHPQEIIPAGVTQVSMGDRGSCVLVNGALRCRGWDPNLNYTVTKSEFAPYTDAQWDIRVLSHAKSDRLIAQAKSPGNIADYLRSHRIIYRNGVVYYMSEVNVQVFPPYQQPGDPSLSLHLQAIPLFGTTAPAGPLSDALSLAPDAACGMGGGNAQAIDIPLFYVWDGSRFSNLHAALQPTIPVLPVFDSYHNALTASAPDIKRIQDCAQNVAGALGDLPFVSVSYVLNSQQGVNVPASLSQKYQHPDSGWVEQLSINNKPGHTESYTVEAYTVSAMRCGDTLLSKWKYRDSPAVTLNGDGTHFNIGSTLLLANARDLTAYPEAELQRAIRAEQGKPGLARPDEARKCLPVVVSEQIVIRYKDKVAQQFSISLPAPQPALAPDCGNALLCKNLPDARGQRVVVLLPSSFSTRRFGDPQPGRRGRKQADDSGQQAVFGAPDDTGQSRDDSMGDDGIAPPGAGRPDSYDLALFVTDSRNGQIYNRYLQKQAYVSGKLSLKQFTLDTGRYILAPGTRAFGLRAEYADPNSLSPQGGTTLKLFVRDGGGLRQVLDGMVMMQKENSWHGACSGTSVDVSRVIDIGATSSHGYADLVVTSTVKGTRHVMSNGQCVEQAQPPKSETVTLHYDGRQYPVPAGLRMAQ